MINLSSYSSKRFDSIEEDYLDELISSSLCFENIEINIDKISLISKIKISKTKKDIKYFDYEVKKFYDKLNSNKLEVLRTLYKNNADLEKTQIRLNKGKSYFDKTIDDIVLCFKKNFSEELIDSLKSLIKNKTKLSINDIPIQNDYLKELFFSSLTLKKLNLDFYYDTGEKVLKMYSILGKHENFFDDLFYPVIDKLTSNRIEVLNMFIEKNFDIESTSFLLNKKKNVVETTLIDIGKRIFGKETKFIFDDLNDLMDKNKFLLESDIPIKNDFIRCAIYSLFSIKKFFYHYDFDTSLGIYILSKSINIEEIRILLNEYSIEKNTNYISHSDLSKLIFYSQESIKSILIEKLLEQEMITKEDKENYSINEEISTIDKDIEDIYNSLSQDYQYILNYIINEKKSQPQIAEIIGKSKQRVNQIYEAAIRKIYSVLPTKLVDLVKNSIIEIGYFPINNLPVKNLFLKNIVIDVLCFRKLKQKFDVNRQLNILIMDRKFRYVNLVSEIIQKVQNIDDKLINFVDLSKLIKSKISNFNAQEFINVLIKNDELIQINDKYFFKSLYKRKRDKVELIYKISPEGFSTENFEELYQKLELYFPNEFKNEDIRNILNVALFTGNIILWDWGRKYIHVDYIQTILEEYDFADLINYLHSSLETMEQIDLNNYFEDNKQSLIEYGIISKYALHSLLKIKYPEEFSYQDSPWVSSLGTERIDLRDTIAKFMDENRIYQLNELSESLQTTNTRIQQLIDRTNEIIIVDTFQYMKREYINFPNELIQTIIDYINEIIENFQFVYIGLIVQKFRKELNIITQYNREILLLDLLKKTNSKKFFNISNTRIVSKNYKITRNSLNFHYIVETNMLNKTESINKNQLFDFFIKRGLSSINMMNYYVYSKYKSIVRIDEDTFIKLKDINLCEKDIIDINKILIGFVDNEINIDELIVKIKNSLPNITCEWNRYLLSDILDNDIFEFYPNRIEPIYIKLK
jgi:predicted XRE-type DNA-binding protein